MVARIKFYFGTAFLVLFLSVPSWAATTFTLPEPTFDYAREYDDFYSYSGQFLAEIKYPGFDLSAGTGTLDLKLLTGGNVKNPDGFQDAVKENNVPSINGSWSASVDLLLDYMRASYGPDFNTPVFVFDLNQNQNEPNLLVNSYMTVSSSEIDSAETREALWAFDNIDNSQYDAGKEALVFIPGSLQGLPNPLVPGTFVDIDNNKGSGQSDFIVYAETMNLADYYGKGFFFNVYFYFEGLNNGFEELYLTGAFAPYRETNPVPEPGTVLLLGAGMLALSAVARRRRAN
jgi:hypothetical protein